MSGLVNGAGLADSQPWPRPGNPPPNAALVDPGAAQ